MLRYRGPRRENASRSPSATSRELQPYAARPRCALQPKAKPKLYAVPDERA